MPGMRRKFREVADQLGHSLPRRDDPFWNHYANTAAGVTRIAIPVKILKDDKIIFEAEFRCLGSPYSLNLLAGAKVLEEFSKRHPGVLWDHITFNHTVKLERDRALKVIYENDIVRAASRAKPTIFATAQHMYETLSSINKSMPPAKVKEIFDQAKNDFVAGVALSAYEVKVKSAFWSDMRRRLHLG